jgi:hypothetical protein
MSVTVGLSLTGTALAPETISANLADLIASAQDIPQNIALTSSFVSYPPPNTSCSRLLIIPTWNGNNDITIAGAGGDTGINKGSLWVFDYEAVKGSSPLFLKCASSTNSPSAILVWL